MRAMALVASLAVTVAMPAVPTVALAQAGATLEDTRDQGILYLRKKLFKQARGRLKAAYRMPGGSTDFRTVFYLGRAAYELLLLEEAFEMADAALKLASTDRHKRSATELVAELSALYGGVTFVRDPQEQNSEGRIFFEAKTGIINKDKKQRFLSIRERFRSVDVKLPKQVYLPYGEYRANGVQFTLVEGQEPAEVPIFLQSVAGDDGGGGSNMWWYVGLGGAAAAAAVVTTVLLLNDPEPDRANIDLGY